MWDGGVREGREKICRKKGGGGEVREGREKGRKRGRSESGIVPLRNTDYPNYLPIHTRSTTPHLTTFNAQYSSLPILQYLTHSVLVLMLDPDVVVVTDVEASNVDLDSPLFPLAISTECHDCSS